MLTSQNSKCLSFKLKIAIEAGDCKDDVYRVVNAMLAIFKPNQRAIFLLVLNVRKTFDRPYFEPS